MIDNTFEIAIPDIRFVQGRRPSRLRIFNGDRNGIKIEIIAGNRCITAWMTKDEAKRLAIMIAAAAKGG